MSENEIVLQGGNVTAVVRIGETVRRQLKPMSSTIHRLLLHLEAMKFDGAPRFLGIDEKQREILSFVSGETDSGQYPFLKPYMRSDEALTEMAWLGKFVPYDRTVHADQRRRRIQLFFEGYGIPQPDNFLEQVEDRLSALCDTLVTRAANGDEAFARMVKEGHLEHYRREIVEGQEHCVISD